MKDVNTSKNKLKHIIRESIREVLLHENTEEEGIDFNPETKTVSYNPYHQRNVDTSIENNPTVDKESLNGVQIWSIFKRKSTLRGDGNPLIYALKGEGWKFRSEADKQEVLKQFDVIASKFASKYPIGVTILVPSSSFLNNYIANIVASKSKDAEILEGVITKLTTEEVDDIVLADNSKFRQVYKNSFNSAYYRLCDYLDAMDREKEGMFTRHYVKDKRMRNILDITFKVSDDNFAKFANKINGQDILVIDDTISRGQTISEVVDILRESYAPKSITVLTLLSKLY